MPKGSCMPLAQSDVHCQVHQSGHETWRKDSVYGRGHIKPEEGGGARRRTDPQAGGVATHPRVSRACHDRCKNWKEGQFIWHPGAGTRNPRFGLEEGFRSPHTPDIYVSVMLTRRGKSFDANAGSWWSHKTTNVWKCYEA